MMKNLSAVILAGRENRHLKTSKSTRPFGDSTVLNRTVQAYLDAGVSEVVLVLGHRGEEIKETLSPIESKIKIVTASEPEGDIGLLLREGVKEIGSSAKAFAIGAGDQPLLTGELIAELADAFVRCKKKILAPVVQRSIGQPVFFDISLAKDFLRLKDHGDAWEILKANSEEIFDLHRYETTIVRSIDDLDDYYAMLDLAKLPRPELPTGKPDEPAVAAAAVGETYHSDGPDHE